MIRYQLLLALLLVFLPQPGFCQESAENSSGYQLPDLLDDGFSSFDEESFEVALDADSASDPLEPVNRFFFGVNDVFYEAFFRPVTHGYMYVLPREIRVCFGNFFYYLATPIRLLNTMLQGEFDKTGVILQRFAINSTFGVIGLVDVATIEFDLDPVTADFGQTLGKWGFDDGVYIVWPFIGPSSVRDSFGLLGDFYTHPIPYFHESLTLDVLYYTSNMINTLSLDPDLYDDLKKFSLDPYIASRQAYLEYRRALVEQP
jgi:phospholipid-binding lipoprotein MlaA